MGFELIVPEDKDELFTLMAEGDYHLLAGGTDLFVKIEKDMVSPERVIDLTKVIEGPKLEDESDTVRISATATHGDLANSSLIKKEFPLLAESAEAVGGVQLRNMATVGGNICNASPSADTLIALYALDARLKLESRDGSRTLPIDEFIRGPGQTDLNQGEFLKAITIPKLSGEYRHYFNKVGRRNALDISVCSMGFALRETDGRIEDIRIAYGAVAPVIVRPNSVEKYLRGKRPNREVITEARELLDEEITPISDIRGSADYRRKVALRNLEAIIDN
ncbi:xanthine dehydrogenase family protein subunit M [Candidatus Bipolaricaulota bacterium]|nr:xanthine dehydrogenase family protein subunit M [Candidatus Bipolaricaulota bacterium]